MLERTMKSFGAAVVFLAVNNLLTVSSNSSTAAGLHTLDIHNSTTALPAPNSYSPTGPGKDESSSTYGTNLSSISEDVLSTSTSRSTTISNLTSPTASTVDSPRALTTEDLKKDVNENVTSNMPTTSPKDERPSVGAEATTLSSQVSSKEATTEPSRETQTQTTKPAITTKVQVSKTEDVKVLTTDAVEQSGTSNRGIKIGAGCVAAVIAVIVLVVIYKICQKKPAAVENTGVKTSAETKENVKLLSVKTEAPNSDTKRTSSNQMECIEC